MLSLEGNCLCSVSEGVFSTLVFSRFHCLVDLIVYVMLRDVYRIQMTGDRLNGIRISYTCQKTLLMIEE